MPRTPFYCLALGVVLLLAGCKGPESTVFPEDGRQQNNPIDNRDTDTLRGRALDGYLQNAFVWLDINGNGQWDEDEPSAETGAGGHFELDIRMLQRDAAVSADLDARDYPLMLLAIPGVTVDEDDDQAIAKGFLLMAPPGVNVITPFTTLIEFERRLLNPFFSGTVSSDTISSGTMRESVTEATRRVKARLGPAVDGFSLQIDYLRNDNVRAAAYGQAVTAFLEAQTRDHWTSQLADGDRSIFNNDLINVLGGLTLLQLPDLIAQAEALIESDGIAGFSTDKLSLPQFGLDQNDPFVIQRQRLYIDREFTPNSAPETMDSSRAALVGFGQDDNLSAVLEYFYDAAGRLVRIDVRGWTDPDLEQLQKLIQVRGRVSLLETQLSPGLLLRYSRADDIDIDAIEIDTIDTDGIDERYHFNWAENRIEWDTTNPEYGAAVAELDGSPEQLITWETDANGRVGQVDRSAGGALQQRLEIDYVDAESTAVAVYRFVGANGQVSQTWQWDPEASTALCDEIAVTTGNAADETVNWRYFDSYQEVAGGEDEQEAPVLQLANSTRAVSYAGAAELTPVEWNNSFFGGGVFSEGIGSKPLDARQPGLLRERVLTLLDRPATSCATDSRSGNNGVLAVTNYDYRRLSSQLSNQYGLD